MPRPSRVPAARASVSTTTTPSDHAPRRDGVARRAARFCSATPRRRSAALERSGRAVPRRVEDVVPHPRRAGRGRRTVRAPPARGAARAGAARPRRPARGRPRRRRSSGQVVVEVPGWYSCQLLPQRPPGAHHACLDGARGTPSSGAASRVVSPSSTVAWTTARSSGESRSSAPARSPCSTPEQHPVLGGLHAARSRLLEGYAARRPLPERVDEPADRDPPQPRGRLAARRGSGPRPSRPRRTCPGGPRRRSPGRHSGGPAGA